MLLYEKIDLMRELHLKRTEVARAFLATFGIELFSHSKSIPKNFVSYVFWSADFALSTRKRMKFLRCSWVENHDWRFRQLLLHRRLVRTEFTSVFLSNSYSNQMYSAFSFLGALLSSSMVTMLLEFIFCYFISFLVCDRLFYLMLIFIASSQSVGATTIVTSRVC